MARLNLPRLAIFAAAALGLLAAAIPLTAFVIIPRFVHSTVHEALPVPAASAQPVAAATAQPTVDPLPASLASGMLRRVDVVHYGSGQVTILELAGARYLR